MDYLTKVRGNLHYKLPVLPKSPKVSFEILFRLLKRTRYSYFKAFTGFETAVLIVCQAMVKEEIKVTIRVESKKVQTEIFT